MPGKRSQGVDDDGLLQLCIQTMRELIERIDAVERRLDAGFPRREVTEKAARRKPILSHLEDYAFEKLKLRRDEEYVSIKRKRITKVCRECGWVFPEEVNADAFCSWRDRQTLSGKTLNDYRAEFNDFFTWLRKRGRAESNPFETIDRIDVRGEQIKPYRACSRDELDRLFAVFPSKLRVAAYLSLYVGLRRGEIAKLSWNDLVLEGNDPHIRVRAQITKNKKSAVIPLRNEVVESLLVYREGKDAKGNLGLTLPKFPRLRKYWLKANVPLENEAGERATFHSLRKSLATLMAEANVPARVAEAVCRHSLGMTYGRYADPNYLPKRKAVESLPSIGAKP